MGGNVSKIKEEREEARERYRPPKKVEEDEYTKPLPPMEKLPPALQKILDNEESLWDSVREGQYVAVPFHSAYLSLAHLWSSHTPGSC